MRLSQSNFEKILNNNFIFEANPKIAVAVSGGPDSMALLFLLIDWSRKVRGTIEVLIVNHNLRKDSKVEAITVANSLIEKKINVKILSVNKNKIKNKSMNEARKNRYKLLTDHCRKHNILHLFIGHHKNDNLETFLTRKLHGSDFEGLDAIKCLSLIDKINIIRPLLDFSKSDILKYIRTKKIFFVSDPSNTNLNYTRPSIRKFIHETSDKNLKEIENEFKIIKKNLGLYNTMISELLIDNILEANQFYVKVDYEKFLKINSLLSEKIVKKIYQLFNTKEIFLRSKKIQILINEIVYKNFKIFNLGEMLVKKSNKHLIFTKKLS